MSGKSDELFAEARKYIPGGVNSPVRAFKSVGMQPVYIARGKGSRVWDADGRDYLDLVSSWGPLILGHADDRILRVIRETASLGTSFGANTELEIRFARLITEIYPSIGQVRAVSSGTEAAMSAIRLARGFTGKPKIIKFSGCYHGHADSFLIKAGSGVLTLGIPGSPGVTESTAADTLTARFNSSDSVEQLFESNKGQVAAVIIEPVMGNAGVILPGPGFLAALRELCDRHGSLLVFDEVITGFRVGLNGAQGYYGVTPDITCLGKIIGGGFPLAAFGGRRDVMSFLAPDGPVYQAGTLSGNPVGLAIGLETISILKQGDVYASLEAKSKKLEEGIRKNLAALGLDYTMNRIGSMMSLFFTDTEVVDFESALTSDTEKFRLYFAKMLEQGIYMAPSQFEAAFVSLAHSEEDLDKIIRANYESLKAVKSI